MSPNEKYDDYMEIDNTVFIIPKRIRIVSALFPLLMAAPISYVLFIVFHSYIVILYPIMIFGAISAAIYKHDRKNGYVHIDKKIKKEKEPDFVIRKFEY